MTYKELKRRVLAFLQDPSYEDSGLYSGEILIKLNKGINQVAKEILLNDLFANDTVTTSTSEGKVAVPANYSKHLTKCFSAAQEQEVEIIKSFPAFVDRYGYKIIDESYEGNIVHVCVLQNNIYYQPIPTSADTLTLYYYRKPTDMAADTDEPDGIPDESQDDLLVSFACKEIYGDMIEDGIEGARANFDFFNAKFENAKADLISNNAIQHEVKRRSVRA